MNPEFHHEMPTERPPEISEEELSKYLAAHKPKDLAGLKKASESAGEDIARLDELDKEMADVLQEMSDLEKDMEEAAAKVKDAHDRYFTAAEQLTKFEEVNGLFDEDGHKAKKKLGKQYTRMKDDVKEKFDNYVAVVKQKRDAGYDVAGPDDKLSATETPKAATMDLEYLRLKTELAKKYNEYKALFGRFTSN